MKVLFSSNRNPNFLTFTDYIEKAFREEGGETVFFENRDFILPGRLREKMGILSNWDLRRLNKRLLYLAETFKPDLFLEAGGWNILPETLESLRYMGIKTALWTIDAPRFFEPIIEASPYYDFVFTGGSEAFEILKDRGVKNLYWLPFACDPDYHRPVELTDEERALYGSDVCFVGSGWEDIYPFRRELLESLVDFNLGIWGPGWESVPDSSPLKRFVRGGETPPDEWVKIYSASRVVFQSHYRDPEGKIPCYQASPRVYEVLACGGFLVVDSQRDILRLFNPGEDLVVFKDKDELKEVVSYYLKNPGDARRIAEKGKEKVINRHTYRHRIRKILSVTGSG